MKREDSCVCIILTFSDDWGKGKLFLPFYFFFFLGVGGEFHRWLWRIKWIYFSFSVYILDSFFFLYEKNWISLSLACSWNFFLFSFRFPFCFLVGRSKLMKFKDDGCWLMRYSFIWWMSLIFQNKVDEIVLLFLFVSTVRTVIECYLKDLDGIENRN